MLFASVLIKLRILFLKASKLSKFFSLTANLFQSIIIKEKKIFLK